MLVPDVTGIPLNPRPGCDDAIIAGKPVASGRILSFSNDRRTARVVWHGTPGTFAFDATGDTIDIGYVVAGKVVIRQQGQDDITITPGSLIEFPRGKFEFEIVEAFTKVSFLYNPNGLEMEAEPL